MEKIIAVTFDIADQKCKMYNAPEWYKFIADTIKMVQEDAPNFSLEELFDYAYGDEFWFDSEPFSKEIYQVAFDLRSEEFIICSSDEECELIMEMARDSGEEDEIFWAE